MMERAKDLVYWYERKDVQFEIIKQLRNREFATLKSKAFPDVRGVRNWRCHNTNHLKAILFDAMHMKRDWKVLQLYKSIDTFKDGLPYQTFNMKKRRKIIGAWNDLAEKKVVEHDFVIDIDADNHEEMGKIHNQAKALYDEFMKKDFEFSVIFSGMGFHFYVYIPTDYDMDLRLAKGFKEIASKIDSSIYNPRRLIKIPYSLAVYEDETYLCYPFCTIEEFINFRLSDYTLANIKKRIDDGSLVIKNRGIHVFNDKCQEEHRLLKELTKI